MGGSGMNYMGGKRAAAARSSRKKTRDPEKTAQKRRAEAIYAAAIARARSSAEGYAEWSPECVSKGRPSSLSARLSTWATQNTSNRSSSCRDDISNLNDKISLDARKRLLLSTSNWSKIAGKNVQRLAVKITPPKSKFASKSPHLRISSSPDEFCCIASPLPPNLAAKASYRSRTSCQRLGSVKPCSDDEIIDSYSSPEEEDHPDDLNSGTWDSNDDIFSLDTPSQPKSFYADEERKVLLFLPSPYCYYSHVSEFTSFPHTLTSLRFDSYHADAPFANKTNSATVNRGTKEMQGLEAGSI
ncbi:MAG: hypothetical protein CYPHOPRED_001723 [Cyphobasidiales sp. Tagirdzhanova-0007]|nr:MAG: hypothetical protein CYPHOPRED_001723 [Cyphobasidiales sp. Tagirdzhanova-0007]